MQIRQCPECKRFSVSFDHARGLLICRWKDCSWSGRIHDLPIAQGTFIAGGPEKQPKHGMGTCGHCANAITFARRQEEEAKGK